MSAVLDVLRMLGVQGGALASVACLMVVFYLFRAKSAGARMASLGAAVVAYTAATLVAIAAALAFGWIDPNPGVITEHLGNAFRVLVEQGSGPGRRFVRWAVDALAGGSA
ncbi:hypothetical protein [Halolamina salina]|uniref:Uncharacterized protein n=1 Tax=Halolamina salina TaxID=1220023 RepID=A0ABD6B824_9EURY